MRQELERWNILSHPLSWVGAVWSSLRVHGKHHTPSIWMPKYRSGNHFWLRLQLEIKELNQLLNHNLSKLGKKIREKRKKKNRIQCDAAVEIRKSGISGFIAIFSIHSTFRIKQPLVNVWPVPAHSPDSPWRTGWIFGGEKYPRYLHPPKKHQEKQVWSHASTKFCPKCDLYTHSCGTEESLPTLQSPQDIWSSGTCQKALCDHSNHCGQPK